MSCIAFLSDFNTLDPYTGIVKGVIAAANPAVRVIDLSHGIPPQDITAGSLILGSSFMYFPKGTIFLAVVDPGVGSERHGIILTHDNYIFVAPDNGLITSVLKNSPSGTGRCPTCCYIDNKKFLRKRVSATFHARDMFAPVAACLSLGQKPEDMGPVCRSPVTLDWPVPVIHGDHITGEVIYIDTFGNLVTSIPHKVVAAADSLNVTARIRGTELPIKNTYSDVEPGKGLCLAGSFKMMEIAVNQGSAEKFLGARKGDIVEIITA